MPLCAYHYNSCMQKHKHIRAFISTTFKFTDVAFLTKKKKEVREEIVGLPLLSFQDHYFPMVT